MKPRLLLPILFAALLLAPVAVAAACNGGGGLSLEQYFQRLDQTFKDSNTRLDALETEFDEAIASPATDAEQIASFRDFFDTSTAVVADTRDALEDIDPPAEAQEAHAKFLAALETVLGLSQDFLNRLADVQSIPDLEELTAEFDPEVTAAGASGDQACFALQSIADQNNIDVDLDCAD